MDKRNQGQKTACAKFVFMDMRLKEIIHRCPSLKPDWPLAPTLNEFQILRPVSIWSRLRCA
jgi:hypothetical protein